MPLRIVIINSLLLFILIASCKKENKRSADCFDSTATVRQVMNTQAIIKLVDGNFYIIEQGAIDTRLKPCNLEKEFQVNQLPITVSGEVKAAARSSGAPCCTENFVITKITR